MFDTIPCIGLGGCLETSQRLLVQAILSLEEANTTHLNYTEPPADQTSPNADVSTIACNITQALERLSKLHILLFGPRRNKDGSSIGPWIAQTGKHIGGFLGEKPEINVNQVLDIALGEDGIDLVNVHNTAQAQASPPQRCDSLMPYMPSLGLALELKNFRILLERKYESTDKGIPRKVVECVDSLEKLFHITRDLTTDCIWNVDHQRLPLTVFEPSDIGKVFRDKCICVAAKSSEAKSHELDPYCPKNPKNEIAKSSNDKAVEDTKEEVVVVEKVDPSEKIHSRELMAEILDMVGPQHVKDHFKKIKDLVSKSYRDETPWVGKHFGAVLMGPAATCKDQIAKRYGKYLISCGICPDNRINREASYIIENDKLEDYFTRLTAGGVLSIENAHLLISYKHKDKLALNYLLEETEKTNGKVTLILYGEEQELREFLAKTKKYSKLFPHVLALNEFKEEDTLTLLRSGMENWFGAKTEVDGGWDGLYMRIAARRLAKKDANIPTEVGALVKEIYQRQRKRIGETRKAKGESVEENTAKVETPKSEQPEEGPGAKSEAPEKSAEVSNAEGSPEVRQQKGKSQEVSSQTGAVSLENEKQPKNQSQASTASKAEAAPSSTSTPELKESKEVDSIEKTSSADVTESTLKVESSDDVPNTSNPGSRTSSGRSTPETEVEAEQTVANKSEGLVSAVESKEQHDQANPPPQMTNSENKAGALGSSDVEVQAPVESLDTEEKPLEPITPAAKDEVVTEQSPVSSTSPESNEPKASDLTAETPSTSESKDDKKEESPVEVPASAELKDEESKKEQVVSESGSESGDESDAGSDTASTVVTTPDDEKEDIEDPEDYTFTKDDILGPAPSNKVLDSESWKKLHKLTGLKKVKESLLNFLELAKANYNRELQEKPLLEFTFNRLFLGPPGTGKTVVAKLYGQILAEIGVLSKGELVVKNASDLIGKYIGDSETNTREALKEGEGNVLVIDEAYMLYTTDGVSNTTDCFRQGIIDTLVGGIQSVPGEDRCVLLLGYEEPMRAFLTESNPGLIRRFPPLEDAFLFEDFTLPELEEILRMKLEEYGLDATEPAIKVGMGVLDKARSRLNFGNGGAVENLITKAKSNFLSRIIAIPEESRPEDLLLEERDFDPEFDRGKHATANLKKLFSDVVGCEDIIKKFEDYQLVCQAMKSRNIDPKRYIPTNFIFKGPPGTGKTTTARKIAQVYYDMGFLSEATVVECSVTELIGSYVGQTGPKTVKALERGLGKVLFIDEAYRLADGGRSSYSGEAVAELVDCLTKPKFFGKIIVILAGYEDEMNALLSMNPGLASRFPEEIMFDLLPAKGCLEVLHAKLKETGIEMPVMGTEDTSFERESLERLLRSLAQTPSWGNARDVETLSKTIARKVFVKQTDLSKALICTVPIAVEVMEEMLAERRVRDGLINVAGMYY